MSDPAPIREPGIPRKAVFLLWFLPVLAVAVALTLNGHPGYAAVLLTGELSMSGVIALATRRPAVPGGRVVDDLGGPALPRLVARPPSTTRPWVVAVAVLATFAVIVVIAVLGSRAG